MYLFGAALLLSILGYRRSSSVRILRNVYGCRYVAGYRNH